jgi:hypothetical protein
VRTRALLFVFLPFALLSCLVRPGGAQQTQASVIYVKHLEPPYYPPLALMTRVGGTIEMKLKIGPNGAVISVESISTGFKGQIPTMLKDDAEGKIKTWTFGCFGCPPNAPFEHTIKFKYVLDDKLPGRTTKTVMDLPDEVTMSAGPIPVEPATTSSKRSQ